MKEGGIVEGLGKTFWAAAMGDRQKHAIETGMIARKITRHHRDPDMVDVGVLHVLFHGVRC